MEFTESALQSTVEFAVVFLCDDVNVAMGTLLYREQSRWATGCRAFIYSCYPVCRDARCCLSKFAQP